MDQANHVNHKNKGKTNFVTQNSYYCNYCQDKDKMNNCDKFLDLII